MSLKQKVTYVIFASDGSASVVSIINDNNDSSKFFPLMSIAKINDNFEYTLDVGTIDKGKFMAEYVNIIGNGTIVYKKKNPTETIELNLNLKFEGITLNCKEFEDKKILYDSSQLLNALTWGAGVVLKLPIMSCNCVIL